MNDFIYIPFYRSNVEHLSFLLNFTAQMQYLGFTEKQCQGLTFVCYCAAIETAHPNKSYVRAALEVVLKYALQSYTFKQLVDMCLTL